MKKSTFFTCLFLTIILIACQSKPINNAVSRENKPQNKSVKIENDFSKSDILVRDFVYHQGNESPDYEIELTKQYVDTVEHSFSNKTSKDLFVITIPKGNFSNTTSKVQVLNKQGEILFERSFESFYLFNGYDVMNLKNAEELKAYFFVQVKGLFGETKFEKANESSDSYIYSMKPEDFTDYESYLSCKKNNQWIFTLSLGEEDNTTFGFNPQKGVVELMSCC